jgi:hypothetical protein
MSPNLSNHSRILLTLFPNQSSHILPSSNQLIYPKNYFFSFINQKKIFLTKRKFTLYSNLVKLVQRINQKKNNFFFNLK